VLEESVENFIVRWKPYLTNVQLHSWVEGSPLLECSIQDTVLHLFERTGPYSKVVGKNNVIIHPTTTAFKQPSTMQKHLHITDISQLHARGVVLHREKHFCVVDAGVPLVVACMDTIPDFVGEGEWVEFDSLKPVHAFIVPPEKTFTYEGAGEI